MIAIKSVSDMIARKRIEEKNSLLYVHNMYYIWEMKSENA